LLLLYDWCPLFFLSEMIGGMYDENNSARITEMVENKSKHGAGCEE
jgi:hypothetical protein